MAKIRGLIPLRKNKRWKKIAIQFNLRGVYLQWKHDKFILCKSFIFTPAKANFK